MKKLTPQEKENFRKNNPLAKKSRTANKKKEDTQESLTQAMTDRLKNMKSSRKLSPNEEMLRASERDIIRHWDTERD